MTRARRLLGLLWLALTLGMEAGACGRESAFGGGAPPGSPGSPGGVTRPATSPPILEGAGLLTALASPSAMADDATLEARVVATVRGARRQVLVTMYLLTDELVVSALIAAHDAGREVRVLLEAAPYGAELANRPAEARLAAAGVDVRWARRPTVGLIHAKLLVVDGSEAIVLSSNFTAAGLTENREYAFIDRDPGDVRWAGEVFAADVLGAEPRAPVAATHLVVAPLDARARLEAAVDQARQTLLVEMEELSDAEMASHLLAARARGVAVTLVLPARAGGAGAVGLGGGAPAALAGSLLGRLVAGGIDVRTLERPTVHAKAMVIDHGIVYVGSVNFSRASFDDNREVGVLARDSAAARLVGEAIEADARRAAPLVVLP